MIKSTALDSYQRDDEITTCVYIDDTVYNVRIDLSSGDVYVQDWYRNNNNFNILHRILYAIYYLHFNVELKQIEYYEVEWGDRLHAKIFK